MLWGELVLEPEVTCAAAWYEKRWSDCQAMRRRAYIWRKSIRLAVERKTRSSLLIPALSSGDPEVHWRLANIMAVQGKDADAQMQAADLDTNLFLRGTRSAFADHGAEFYAGSGRDCRRALELALVNVANRPTLRAFEQAHEMAVAAGDARASELLIERPPNTGAVMSALGCRPWPNGKKQSHDGRSPYFPHGRGPRCRRARRGNVRTENPETTSKYKAHRFHDRWMEHARR